MVWAGGGKWACAAAVGASLAGATAAVGATNECRRLGDSFYALVMEEPVYAPTILLDGAKPAAKGLSVASQTIVVKPRVGYLAAPVALAEAGSDYGGGVPLAAGAPVSDWYGVDGVRHCALGWKNGLFGGATGDGHMRWACFEDRDGDGAFEIAWRPWSGNMGLSSHRRDFPVSPPVRLVPEPAASADVKVPANATLAPTEILRTVTVTKVAAEGVTVESRIGEGGYRSGAQKALLTAAAPEATLSGIRVTLSRGPAGEAVVSAQGDFPHDLTRVCDDTQVVIGEVRSVRQFSFPVW